MNTQNLTIFDISSSVGLFIPKNILDYLVEAYGKKQTINILSETVGFKIEKFNPTINDYLNESNTNSLDFKESNESNESNEFENQNKFKQTKYDIEKNRVRSESNYSYTNNVGEDCTDEIQAIRDNFYKKYLEKFNNVHNNNINYKDYQDCTTNIKSNDDIHNDNKNVYDDYLIEKKNINNYYKKNYKNNSKNISEDNLEDNLKNNSDDNFIKMLSDDWVVKYLKEDENKLLTQSIIKKAYNDGMLDLLDPYLVDCGKLQKAWDVIHKYELWIENIDDKYWEKLVNLIKYEYKYVKL